MEAWPARSTRRRCASCPRPSTRCAARRAGAAGGHRHPAAGAAAAVDDRAGHRDAGDLPGAGILRRLAAGRVDDDAPPARSRRRHRTIHPRRAGGPGVPDALFTGAGVGALWDDGGHGHDRPTPYAAGSPAGRTAVAARRSGPDPGVGRGRAELAGVLPRPTRRRRPPGGPGPRVRGPQRRRAHLLVRLVRRRLDAGQLLGRHADAVGDARCGPGGRHRHRRRSPRWPGWRWSTCPTASRAPGWRRWWRR